MFLDVVKLDELDIVVTAHFAHGFVDGFAQFGVEERANLGIGIALLQHVEEAGEGWTEVFAVVFGPVGVLVFAYW